MNNYQGRFTSILKQEAIALDDLHDILMRELTALKNRDTESVFSISEEKNAMLNKIIEIDSERSLHIEGNSHENSVTFTNEITLLNSEIENTLNKCKQQNSINGGIIEMSQLFNEKMLDIISGNSEKPSTYSATGKNNCKPNQHSLGRV